MRQTAGGGAADASYDDANYEELFDGVERVTASAALRHRDGGDATQPVHTLYVAADRFSAGSVAQHGLQAQRLLRLHLPDGATLARVFAVERRVAERVHARVAAKLAQQPVEDLRIDFEDGYGVRDGNVEDSHARACASSLAGILADEGRPRRVGLRVKSFADGTHRRSVRTLRIFLEALLAAHGEIPRNIAVTFPKVIAVEHVRAFASVLDRVEQELALPAGTIGFEIQVETPRSIIDARGRVVLPAYREAAAGRLRAAVFGVFDYTAALGLPAGQQRLRHPACDAARHAMQVSLAGTGVELSDGSTIAIPLDETSAAVHAVWRRHRRDVRHSLRHGYWQGWDVHPAHLVSRFATVYAFHLADIDRQLRRVDAWAQGQAGTEGVLDEPATLQALLGQLRRALACGALLHSEMPAAVHGMLAARAGPGPPP